MKKTKWINRWIIQSPFCIGLCVSEESFIKELRRLKVPQKNWPEFVPKNKDGRVHLFQNNKALCAILCIRENNKATRNEITGLIVHESVHIWQEIRDAKNEYHPSAEYEAEAIQNISQRLIEEYFK